MPLTAKTTKAADPLRFLALAAVWNLAFFAVLRTPWCVTHAAMPLAAFQQAVAAWYGGRSSVPVTVTLECSGTDMMALAAGVILAFPVSWRRRLGGVAVVLPALLLLNIVRIGTLSLAAGSPALFNRLHLYVWPVVLIAAASGLVFAWMRAAGLGGRGLGRAWRLAVGCLGGFALAVPLVASSAAVSWAGEFVASAAAGAMQALGAPAAARGPLFTTPRGAFVVTSDCLLSPVIPLWVLAVLWWPLKPWQRAAGLALTVPVVAGLAVARLLVLAVPGAWVGSPLVVVHGFHQLVVFAALVVVAALHAAQRGGEPPARAAARALAIVVVSALAGMALGPAYDATVLAAAGLAATWAPHTLETLLPPGDVQGALALLPVFQAALLGALAWSLGRPAAWRRLAWALAAQWLSQVGLLVALGELEARYHVQPHALALRGWAVALPCLLAFLVTRRQAAAAGEAERRAGYRRFWDEVGAGFPDLGGAASTAFYFENEKRLVTAHLGSLAGLHVLKTDLWDEARNTRILQWMQAQGARVAGVDISGPVVRLARAGFDGARLAAVGGDVRALPFADGVFDAVYSMGTIEHFPESDVAVRECLRVLKPGGCAIIGVPNRFDPFFRPAMVALLSAFGLYGYGEERSFSRRSLGRLLEAAGFEVVADDGILFIPGFLRMLDLWCHTRCRPLGRVTGCGVSVFAWIDARVPAVRKHGYLIVAVGRRPEGPGAGRAER